MIEIKETYESEDLQCPYCKEFISDSWEYNFDDDSLEIECDCGKKFYGSESIIRNYIGKANCELNGTKHNYQKVKDYSFVECKTCGDSK